MVTLGRIALRLIEDALRWVVLLFRSTESVQTREPLPAPSTGAVHRARRPAATGRCGDSSQLGRPGKAVRLFDWRSALVVVQPATMIRWHRAGWRLFWRLKCRPGRPPIPKELRALIRRLARENVLWGEERIANELLLKLGIRISPRTVRKYLPKRPPGRLRGDLRWSTFPRCRRTPGVPVRAKYVLRGLHHEYSVKATSALPYGIRAAEPNDGNRRSADVRCRAVQTAFLRSTERSLHQGARASTPLRVAQRAAKLLPTILLVTSWPSAYASDEGRQPDGEQCELRGLGDCGKSQHAIALDERDWRGQPERIAEELHLRAAGA